MTKHEEPMEHLWPAEDQYIRTAQVEDAMRREYRAGFWLGMLGGIISGVCFAPVVWFGVMMWSS